ncbi:MAG: uracil phosphoribosyltransferase [Bdellovibrionaceae bacterium]|nr:uracil phosphoribosyltransferase [Bdellovibrio sp.]
MTTENHHYGPQFHLVNNVFLETLLTRLCISETHQPEINRLVEKLYHGLIETAANHTFKKEIKNYKTRMSDLHPGIDLTAQTFYQNTKAVCVNLARAGTFPSHICYDFLHSILPAENLRQDHIFAARQTDVANKVTRTQLGSFKIGGHVEKTYVIFPDPMGATGGTLTSAIDHYEQQIEGRAEQYIALHLIVTPEYLKRVLKHSPRIQVFALRVDRGLSSADVLKSPLGLYWDQEKGLNENQYIVPGAGGLGELLNNSYV